MAVLYCHAFISYFHCYLVAKYSSVGNTSPGSNCYGHCLNVITLPCLIIVPIIVPLVLSTSSVQYIINLSENRINT